MKNYKLKLNIVILGITMALEIAGVGYLAVWREWFWSSVSDKHLHDFMLLLSYFSLVALALCAIAGYGEYLQRMIALDYRRKLTYKALSAVWYYQSIEGYRQRIQEDTKRYPLLLVNLACSLISSVILIIVYSIIIIKQVGLIFLLLPCAYALISTFVAGGIARPLIGLNYLNQVAEAAFRQSLKKIHYSNVHRANYKLYRKEKHLKYFQSFYGQISVIVPYVMLAPIYFTGIIVFGTLMQVAACITHLIESMSMVIDSWSDINDLLACRKRLKELEII